MCVTQEGRKAAIFRFESAAPFNPQNKQGVNSKRGTWGSLDNRMKYVWKAESEVAI